MDIYLDFGSAAIAIENKPWANDQDAQCKDYLNQLKNSHPSHYCLVYLSASGEIPSDDSIPEADIEEAEGDGYFKAIGYTDLLDWLKDCRRECQADRIAVFLSEFSDYIQKEFVGLDMTDVNDIAGIALKDSETLQAALELGQAQSHIKERLLEQLKNQLEERLDDWWLEWELNSKNKCAGFQIGFPELQKYTVRFQFEGTRHKWLGYGILQLSDEALPDLPEVRHSLNTIIAQGQQFPGWLWWHPLPDPFYNWDSHVEPWLDIKNGRMADLIIEKTQEIHTTLNEANLLKQLDGLGKSKPRAKLKPKPKLRKTLA